MLDIDGIIKHYKERDLVANGYMQHKWVDYEETFSLTVWFTMIFLIIAIIESLYLELH